MTNSQETLAVEGYFKQVRQLTVKAAEFVDADELEQCQQAIEQRLTLIKQLYFSLQSNSDMDIEGVPIEDAYANLVQEIQCIDDKAMVKLAQSRQAVQEKTITQTKTKHALKQYQAYR